MITPKKILKFSFTFGILILGIVLIIIGGIWASFYDFKGKLNITDLSYKIDADKNTTIRNIEIKIDCGEVEIYKGDTFSVEAKNVMEDHFSSSHRDDTVKIEYDLRNDWRYFICFDNSDSSNIPVFVITVPEQEYDKIVIDLGVGKSKIDGLNCSELILDNGVGKTDVFGSTFKDVDIDGGIGEVDFSRCVISGNCSIDGGIGEIDMELIGNISDYSFDVDNGIGKARINDRKASKYSSSGKKSHFDIDVGIGQIDIEIEPYPN